MRDASGMHVNATGPSDALLDEFGTRAESPTNQKFTHFGVAGILAIPQAGSLGDRIESSVVDSVVSAARAAMRTGDPKAGPLTLFRPMHLALPKHHSCRREVASR